MSIRNFWIQGTVDGSATPIGTGPRGAGGGFELFIFIREHGESVEAVKLVGCAYSDGALELTIRPLHEHTIGAGCDTNFRIITHR